MVIKRKWYGTTIEEKCEEINRSLAILLHDVSESAAMPVEIETYHLAQRFHFASLMRKMGLIETVRRGGGPTHQGASSPGITTTTYRITRRSINPEELETFLSKK